MTRKLRIVVVFDDARRWELDYDPVANDYDETQIPSHFDAKEGRQLMEIITSLRRLDGNVNGGCSIDSFEVNAVEVVEVA